MICKKCGNEIQENENFCGKCGMGIKDKEPIKISLGKVILLFLVVILGLGIGSNIIISNKVKNMGKNADKYFENTSNSQTDNNYNKEYYDFIDTNYYTFNFTEDELIKGICGGKNYTSVGFQKYASNKDRNANIYSAADTYGVNTITITNDPRNFKVKKLEISYISHTTLTKETSDKQASDMYMLGLNGIIFARDKNNYATDKQKEEIQEILNQLANSSDRIHKGLKLSINRNTKDIDICYEIIK